MGRVLDNPVLIERIQKAYADSLAWCEADPDACGVMAVKYADILTPEAIADSVRTDQTAFVTARDARPELEFFYSQLAARQPALIGGKLPPADFYHGAGDDGK